MSPSGPLPPTTAAPTTEGSPTTMLMTTTGATTTDITTQEQGSSHHITNTTLVPKWPTTTKPTTMTASGAGDAGDQFANSTTPDVPRTMSSYEKCECKYKEYGFDKKVCICHNI